MNGGYLFFRINELENKILKTQKQLEALQTSLNKLIEVDDKKCPCETEAKAPMLRFVLDGCDISFNAEAPADMTLAQLLKQCDRIHPDYCACGIRSTDEEPELIFGYDRVDYIRGETGHAACSIDGVNPPECKYCKHLVEAVEDGIQILNIKTGEPILLLYTDHEDYYYPYCHFEYNPGNMEINKERN